ncbi:MAG: anthranilate phosphoribosyltransferase [Rhizobiales bacterium]|nr:anthranilate phosphoribosyltransferase [Hyphomicrobiales bacterium]
MSDLKPVIMQLSSGDTLSEDEARAAFSIVMSGAATPAQIGAFLMALRVRGESVNEITGGVRVMREQALKVNAPANAIDVVGTGGDGHGTYNVSTAVALVIAALGVPVAKHGNRKASSLSGTADVLQMLGLNLDITPDQISDCIDKAGIGFMFAQAHHAAMKHVAPVRADLGIKSIFNLMGPLSNPAGVKHHLIGVYASHLAPVFAEVLRNLSSTRAWVVHGSDGMDELTTTGPSHVAELKDGHIKLFDVSPSDAGLSLASLEDLKGGDPAYNAKAVHRLLDGERGPYRDIVLLNAAAALIVADKVTALKDGAAMAAAALDDGRAKATLAKLVAASNGDANV